MDSLGNVTDARYYSMNAPSCGFLCRDLMVTSTNDVIAWERTYSSPCGGCCVAMYNGRSGKDGPQEGRIRFFKDFLQGDVIAGHQYGHGWCRRGPL